LCYFRSMNIEEFRGYCLTFRGVTEGFPFNENTLVFKVRGKIFALADIDIFERINLKCHPEKAVELREQYTAVLPGYHMNKKHWNTVMVDGSVPDHLLKEWIKDSYNLVVQGLSNKEQEKLKQLK
jgi:predicted DNA-binding protein (MmcQ/YjbR family)